MVEDGETNLNRRLSEHLRQLLLAQPYRRMWERHVKQRRPTAGDLSQAAVARVVADYLVESGEQTTTDGALDRQLKDRIGRALAGKSLSGGTLQWIIDAFDISDRHTAELWSRFAPPPPGAVTAEAATRPYRNVAIHELHNIGADGLPATHRTVQVIQAGDEPVTNYTYRFDTNTADVQVVRGGSAGPTYETGEGLFAVDITFSRPLAPGQTASLEYFTTFRYRQPPEPQFRRASVRRIDSLELGISFHPSKLPKRLHWATWAALDSPPILHDEVELDPEHSAHRFLRGVEVAVVGFRWEW